MHAALLSQNTSIGFVGVHPRNFKTGSIPSSMVVPVVAPNHSASQTLKVVLSSFEPAEIEALSSVRRMISSMDALGAERVAVSTMVSRYGLKQLGSRITCPPLSGSLSE